MDENWCCHQLKPVAGVYFIGKQLIFGNGNVNEMRLDHA